MATTNGERKDNYLLDRGGLASARLTAQHFVITERQGWLLHPDIEKSVAGKKDLKIADVATGNGIWALSLAKSYPDAKIVGLDISSEQFPPAFTLPSNVSLDYCNILQPIPDKFKNAFDVVHIRLIVAAIYDQDKDMLINNILSLLKPGGYLQWDEVGNNGSFVVDESLHIDKRRRSYIDRIDNMSGVMSACVWVNELPQALQRNGFEDVLQYDPPVNTSLLLHESDCFVWSIQELINVLKDLPKQGIKEEMAEAAKEFREDVDAGTMFAYDWRIAVGRKSISA